jgi:dihydropteroate synthase
MLTLEHLAELADQHRQSLNIKVREFSLLGRTFAFNERPSIMGVINLSPDSWYRESVCLRTDQALCRAKIMREQGADLVDVGAESTLAHAARQDVQQQVDRLSPVVRGISEAQILVSVETYEAAVARQCLEDGARVINYTGTDQAKEMFALAVEHEAAVILCYVQGAQVRAVGDFDFGQDPVDLMYEYFARQIEQALRQGLEKIILDPGLGFYYRNLQDSQVRIRHQMRTFLNTFRLRTLGFPICHALPHAFEYFAEEVRCAEPFFALLAALGKTDLFRTHEVPRVKAVLDTLGAY